MEFCGLLQNSVRMECKKSFCLNILSGSDFLRNVLPNSMAQEDDVSKVVTFYNCQFTLPGALIVPNSFVTLLVFFTYAPMIPNFYVLT